MKKRIWRAFKIKWEKFQKGHRGTDYLAMRCQVKFDPGDLAQVSLVKESKAAANHHHANVIYMLMYQPAVMQGPWSGIAMKGFEPATCGSVF